MRVVLQRVKQARVEVDGQIVGSIGHGLLIFVGIAKSDVQSDAEYLADKTASLRIFSDDNGKMNRNILEAGGSILVVSQFTLYGDTKKGRRPGFDLAAPPEQARALYEYFIKALQARNLTVQTGIFQARMLVHLTNDGPVTFLCDSEKTF